MAEKKIKGRKRHIVTDTQGHILYTKVHAANIHDTKAGCEVFEEALKKYPTLQGVSADAGYRKTMENFVNNVLNKSIMLSKKAVPKNDTVQWMILKKRWIVERTFAWFNNFRRLSKEYEYSVSSSECNIMISHSSLLLNRLG